MEAYADYNYYTEVYLGNTIPEGDFPRLSLRASSWLKRMLPGEADPNSESVKMACCAVAEAWQTNEQGGELISQSVGSWSKAYAQKKPKTDEQRLIEAARVYLPNLSTVVWA